ncbi:MAG: hypothetical protein K0S74_1721 [Chlamydiales bacterium]|jgi:hypothetical protein|nr:hypothetical protein [Chlamydiales bacterium]
MTNTFKLNITRRLLQIIKNEPIGKACLEELGCKLENILKYCGVEVPQHYKQGAGWTVTWSPKDINIDPSSIRSLEILFKLVWLYSDHEKVNEDLNSLVAQELTLYGAGLKLQANYQQKIKASQTKRPWIELADWITSKLISKKTSTNLELWSALPESCNEEDIYLDGEILYCSFDKHRHIKFRAFCDHVKNQRIALGLKK